VVGVTVVAAIVVDATGAMVVAAAVDGLAIVVGAAEDVDAAADAPIVVVRVAAVDPQAASAHEIGSSIAGAIRRRRVVVIPRTYPDR
jgi:hypothetical protein